LQGVARQIAAAATERRRRAGGKAKKTYRASSSSAASAPLRKAAKSNSRPTRCPRYRVPRWRRCSYLPSLALWLLLGAWLCSRLLGGALGLLVFMETYVPAGFAHWWSWVRSADVVCAGLVSWPTPTFGRCSRPTHRSNGPPRTCTAPIAIVVAASHHLRCHHQQCSDCGAAGCQGAIAARRRRFRFQGWQGLSLGRERSSLDQPDHPRRGAAAQEGRQEAQAATGATAQSHRQHKLRYVCHRHRRRRQGRRLSRSSQGAPRALGRRRLRRPSIRAALLPRPISVRARSRM